MAPPQPPNARLTSSNSIAGAATAGVDASMRMGRSTDLSIVSPGACASCQELVGPELALGRRRCVLHRPHVLRDLDAVLPHRLAHQAAARKRAAVALHRAHDGAAVDLGELGLEDVECFAEAGVDEIAGLADG